MSALSVRPVPRVWRIQGDLFPDAPAQVQAFIATDLVDATDARIGSGGDTTVSRSIDAIEGAKTISVGGKTYTRGELLNAIAAMALAWKSEDGAAAEQETAAP